MSSAYFMHKWKERFKMLWSLPLPNRALRYFPPEFSLRDPIVSLLHKYRSQGHTCALLLFYLEDFHHFFSTYGSVYTDKLHQEIRDAMKSMLPGHLSSEEIIGVTQYGGENFCVFLKGSEQLQFEELQRKGILLRKQLESALNRRNSSSTCKSVQFQMGCYLFGTETENTEAAIQSAIHYARSIATKKLPPDFSPSRQELARILHHESITVLAQPIISLTDGEVFGWEILTRGPQNTPLHTPADLFEFAYQADLLTKMEFLVMKKALEEIHHRGIKEQVFINITPISLGHPLFLDQLLGYLKQYPHIQPSQIVLEITERHTIRDYAYMGTILAQYRAYGFRFAVDDAGAGYSSLQSISELIPDIIKIDKSVIQNIDRMSVKQSLLKALLYFAENMNCSVVAEGVEREEEAKLLMGLKVQMGRVFITPDRSRWPTTANASSTSIN